MAKLQQTVLTVLGIGMVCLITVNSLGRYLISSSIVWAEEFTRIMFVWGCFIAITIGFATHSHIGFDMLSQKSKLGAKISRFITAICLTIVGVVVTWYGIEFIQKVGKFPLPATDLPVWVLYGAGIVAGVIWIGLGIRHIIQLIRTAVSAGKGE